MIPNLENAHPLLAHRPLHADPDTADKLASILRLALRYRAVQRAASTPGREEEFAPDLVELERALWTAIKGSGGAVTFPPDGFTMRAEQSTIGPEGAVLGQWVSFRPWRALDYWSRLDPTNTMAVRPRVRKARALYIPPELFKGGGGHE